MIRTQSGTLRKEHIEQEVTLKGWVQKRRDLGGLIFIDLRDRSGIVQVVFNPETSPEALKTAEDVRSEYVLEVKGMWWHVIRIRSMRIWEQGKLKWLRRT